MRLTPDASADEPGSCGRPWYCFGSLNATQPMTLLDGTPLSPALGIGAFADKTLVAAGQAVKIDPAAYIPAVRGYYSLPDGRMASMPLL